MHDPSIRNPAYQSLTDQKFFEIDELCDRFDRELVSGDGPRIEAFLAEAPEADRHELLAELLTIEIDFRLSRGEQATADEYLSRFPDCAGQVEKAFDFARESDVPTGPVGQFDEPTVTIAQADSEVSRVGAAPQSRRTGDATSFAPQPFGRYTLLRLLGKGGMGSVYLAHDSELDRKVAIKFPEFDDRPDVAAAAIERFRREARAMATVHHPNICPIFDVGQHKGRHYLTMAWIDGQNLSEAAGSLSQTEVVRLVMTTARAVHAAHQAGVVHRDLKPSNVMLDQRGEPIVMDFGLASRSSVSDSGLTHSGLIIGSPAYMAPEQVEAEHEAVGPRTDVYALGVILYQLLTGRRPFDGAGLSVLGKIAAGIRPESPSQIAAVSPALEAICLQAMAHRIEDRFESAKDLADSLDRWLTTPDFVQDQARPSRRKTALMAGGIAALALSSLLLAITSRPDPAEKLPGAPDAIELHGSGIVTASTDDRQELIPASDAVPNVAAPEPLKAPFDQQQAKAGQQAWADYFGVPVEYTNSIGMTFRLIPPGEYLMGNTPEGIEATLRTFPQPNMRAAIESEGPQRPVVTKPFYLGVTEVTQAQYKQVTGINPSCFAATGRGKDAVPDLETDDYPVESVSRFDATDFCVKLNQLEHRTALDSRADETATSKEETGYRLPTEEEWEFACRAGTDTPFCFGESVTQFADYGWFTDNANGTTHPVRTKDPNPWGLYDTFGNAWEWCQNRSVESPSGPVTDASRSLSGEGVLRGGSWKDPAAYCRSACRSILLPDSPFSNSGFRVALTVDAVKELLGETAANAPPVAVAPFDEKQALAHQQAWAKHLGVPVEYTNSIGMKFRLIPPGEFLMGSTPEEIEAALKVVRYGWQANIESAGPQHQVVLTKPIYVGVTEVTQSQYEQVMGFNPSFFSAAGRGKDAVTDLDTSHHPVESMSWFDAVDFCIKLSQQEARTPFYSRSGETVTSMEGTGYRLPTAAEWEHACRAGTTTWYWSSDQERDLFQGGWFVHNSGGHTHPVGELEANPFGLNDVHGNVWEWVEDSWDPTFYAQFQETTAIDPSAFISRSSPGDLRRVFRGGNWDSYASECRSSFHLNLRPSSRPNYVGFRVVLLADSRK